MTENDYAIIDPDNPTNQDKTNKQYNTMALNIIYNAIDSKVFEQIKDYERANQVWTRLEETYEGTPAVKSAKLYILKDKLTSFKMKEDESILEMFHQLQVRSRMMMSPIDSWCAYLQDLRCWDCFS